MKGLTRQKEELTKITEKEPNCQEDPMAVFLYALKASETRRQYPRRLKVFFDFLDLEEPLEKQAKDFLSDAKRDPLWAQSSFMRFITFQKERAQRGEISYSTISNYYKATKLFVEMNTDTPIINWKKIAKGIPSGRRAANDRAPTIEELRKLSEYPDRRIRPIVYVMASSGIRLGAWDYLRWKYVTPVSNEEASETIAAKLVVYAGEPDEYYCYITQEAYFSLKQWLQYREEHGEHISGDSWLMRDLWQTTDSRHGAKFGLATIPKKLKSSGIKSLMERALRAQGLCKPLQSTNRREWKGAHGLRKYYKSHAEQIMKPINVELTMGHDIGISASYYKPTEQEVLEDYLKAVDLLTINGDKTILQKKVLELEEKRKDDDYIIKAKLKEKDEQLHRLSEKYDMDIEMLKEAISDMQELLKNPTMLAKMAEKI